MYKIFNSLLVVTLLGNLAEKSLYAEENSLDKPKPDLNQMTTSLGIRVDCLHNFNHDKGSNQSCANITGLRLRLTQFLSNEFRASIRFDPFGTTIETLENSAYRDDLPSIRDTKFLVVDNYSFVWMPRSNLELAIEEYGGAVKIPSLSGLGLASSFQYIGWDQTALTATYHLNPLAGMRVKFAAGNGEGENGENLDPQQFFGFEFDASIIKGVILGMGMSFDGNNVGSRSYEWENQKYENHYSITPPPPPSEGYSTQRLRFSAMLDGDLAVARGLKLAAGWQRSIFSDLNKKDASAPSASVLGCGPLDNPTRECKSLDMNWIFVEDPESKKANTVQRTVIGLNGSYKILDKYFTGFDYETRKTDLGEVSLFEVCKKWSSTTCTEIGKNQNFLRQSAFTLGAGFTAAENMILSIEYNRRFYDKSYRQAFYVGRNDRASEIWEAFDARISYNWQ